MKKKQNNEESKKKSKSEEEAEKTVKEIEDLLNNFNELIGDDQEVIKIEIPTRRKKLIGNIFEIVISFVLLISLTGFISWVDYNNIWLLFASFGILIFLERFFKMVIEKNFLKYVILSLGSIYIIASILAIILTFVFIPFVKIINYGNAFLVFVLFLGIRKLFEYLISKR